MRKTDLTIVRSRNSLKTIHHGTVKTKRDGRYETSRDYQKIEDELVVILAEWRAFFGHLLQASIDVGEIHHMIVLNVIDVFFKRGGCVVFDG